MHFMGSSTRYDDMTYEVTSQIFGPMSRDLRRLIERLGRADGPFAVPAADRVVTLDHNKPEYAETVEALRKVEDAVRETNDYDDLADKEQRIAEIKAGRGLLQAARVRVEALVAVLYRGLKYLSKKFADVSIGEAAKYAFALLGKLTGLW